MRILANENFPGEAIEALRSRGHDVAWVKTDAPGSSDEEVIARATREGRLLITFDKDFGALAFRSGLSAPSGIILFRISSSSPSRVGRDRGCPPRRTHRLAWTFFHGRWRQVKNDSDD